MSNQNNIPKIEKIAHRSLVLPLIEYKLLHRKAVDHRSRPRASMGGLRLLRACLPEDWKRCGKGFERKAGAGPSGPDLILFHVKGVL
jgi:hypothetical protein